MQTFPEVDRAGMVHARRGAREAQPGAGRAPRPAGRPRLRRRQPRAGALHARQLHAVGVVLVEGVDRVAAGDQARARRGRAVGEGAAHRARIERAPGQHIGGEGRVREHHPAEADHSRLAALDHRLRDVRQPVLQVGVRAAHDRQRRMRVGDLGGRRQLARDPDERVLGRPVPVRRREVGRPLHVRVVVGAPGGDAHEPDAQVGERGTERVRLGEVDARPVPSPPKA